MRASRSGVKPASAGSISIFSAVIRRAWPTPSFADEPSSPAVLPAASPGRCPVTVYGVAVTDLPPPSDPAGVPPAPGTPFTGTLGPLGKPRSAWLVILLTVVTLGIWSVVWSYQNGEEIKQHARTGLGGVAYLFITLLISPITMFLMASEVEQLYRREGKEPPITTIWGLWFLLPLIGNLIWYFRIQKSINDYWTAHGSTVSPGL